jgi:hypothetical protein
MTQPIFGVHAFAESPQPNAQDAFDLVTGEVLQAAVAAAHPARQFLVNENVQAVADRVNGNALTAAMREREAGPYVGLWIIVAFALGDHRSRFGMEIVTAARPADPNVPVRYRLTCIFDTETNVFDTEPFGDRLMRVKVGDRLTVAGRIDQLNANEIRLRDCELL